MPRIGALLLTGIIVIMLTPVSERLISEAARQTPYLVAIEGFGGAGKSTLAARLAETVPGSVVVPMDAFIVRHLHHGPCAIGYDRARLHKQVLRPVLERAAFAYQIYDWAACALGTTWVQASGVNVLIVEGLTAYHPEIEARYHLKIWVDTPIEVARARGQARDAGNENAQCWDQWAAEDLTYAQTIQPRERADVIVSGLANEDHPH